MREVYGTAYKKFTVDGACVKRIKQFNHNFQPELLMLFLFVQFTDSCVTVHEINGTIHYDRISVYQ